MHAAPWLIPAEVAGLTGSLFLVWVYAFLHSRYRERFLLLWTWSWSFSALRLAFALAAALGPRLNGLLLPTQLCVLASGLFLLYGTAAFLRRRLSPGWLLGGGLGAAWLLLGQLGHLSFALQTLPAYTFFALVSIGTGWLFFSARELDPAGRRVTAWGLILWGLHKADYPFLRPVPRLAPWDYLIGGLLSFAVAVGMLLVYFEKVRRGLLRSEERHEQAEARLRRQTTLLQTLVETIPAPLFYKDAAGVYLGCNEAFARYLGRPRAEIVGRDVYGVAPAELAAVYQRADQELLRQGGTQVYESKVPFADGSRHDVLFHKAVFAGEGGETAGLLGVMLDITKRKEAEERLRNAHQMLEAVFRAAPAAILTLDPHNRVTLWNPAAEQIFGWSREEILGRPYPLVPSEGWEEHRQIRCRVQEGEVIRRQKVRRSDRQGKVVDVSLSGAPLGVDAGEPRGAMFILEDITESCRVQAEQVASEERYRVLSHQFRTLLDGITDSLVLLDAELKIVWANAGTAHHFGLAPEELPGRYCYTVWRQRQSPCEVCPVRESFTTGAPRKQLMETPDGRTWGVKTFPIRDAQGEVCNVIHLASNITEKIRLRQEAEAANRLASLGSSRRGSPTRSTTPTAWPCSFCRYCRRSSPTSSRSCRSTATAGRGALHGPIAAGGAADAGGDARRRPTHPGDRRGPEDLRPPRFGAEGGRRSERLGTDGDPPGGQCPEKCHQPLQRQLRGKPAAGAGQRPAHRTGAAQSAVERLSGPL